MILFFALVKGNGNHNVSCWLIGRFEPVADHFVDDFGVSAIIDAETVVICLSPGKRVHKPSKPTT